MTASSFSTLGSSGRVALISGQATILYGAATFSEDVDLWVNPSVSNFERFLQALRKSHARYYELTPAFTIEAAASRHGFHFIIPVSTSAPICLSM